MSSGQRQSALRSMRNALAGQLDPAWRLTWRAIELVRALPPGERVPGRWERDQDEFVRYAEYLRNDRLALAVAALRKDLSGTDQRPVPDSDGAATGVAESELGAELGTLNVPSPMEPPRRHPTGTSVVATHHRVDNFGNVESKKTANLRCHAPTPQTPQQLARHDRTPRRQSDGRLRRLLSPRPANGCSDHDRRMGLSARREGYRARRDHRVDGPPSLTNFRPVLLRIRGNG